MYNIVQTLIGHISRLWNNALLRFAPGRIQSPLPIEMPTPAFGTSDDDWPGYEQKEI